MEIVFAVLVKFKIDHSNYKSQLVLQKMIIALKDIQIRMNGLRKMDN